MDYRKEITAYFEKEKQVLDSINKDDLNDLMNLLMNAREEGKNIFIMGNGGSAATASHYVCDFNKGISYGKEKMFKFICLNDNIPTMIIVSDRDEVCLPDQVEEIYDNIACENKAIYHADSAHIEGVIDDPDAYMNSVESFLNGAGI